MSEEINPRRERDEFAIWSSSEAHSLNPRWSHPDVGKNDQNTRPLKKRVVAIGKTIIEAADQPRVIKHPK